MAKLTYLDSCVVLEEDAYDADNPKMGRFVRVQFASDGDRTRRITLDKELHHAAPVGSSVRLVLADRLDAKGVQRRDNSIGTVQVEKRRVVGFEDVKALPAERKAA